MSTKKAEKNKDVKSKPSTSSGPIKTTEEDVTATPKLHDHFPYNIVPASEKTFGCFSQRAGCIIIGVGQIVLGVLSITFQTVLALMARGGIDLTDVFGKFPNDESIKKFIFGVSLVDMGTKMLFTLSGFIIIVGAIRRHAALLNTWMTISNITFTSSVATNLAAAGGVISFAETREEYAVPLSFDTILMGVQFYVMTIVKGYHKHLEKAELALQLQTYIPAGPAPPSHTPAPYGPLGPKDDHSHVGLFRYEEHIHKGLPVDHVKLWVAAEEERRLSLRQHAAEHEQKRLRRRAKEAEKKYQRLQQALLEKRRRERSRDGGEPTLGQSRPSIGEENWALADSNPQLVPTPAKPVRKATDRKLKSAPGPSTQEQATPVPGNETAAPAQPSTKKGGKKGVDSTAEAVKKSQKTRRDENLNKSDAPQPTKASNGK